MTLIFATNNQNKVKEIQSAIGSKLQIITLRQAGIDIDIPEPHDTLEANATEKSRTIHELTQHNCFSEDSGLEVEALDGAPGVKSARYAGNHDDNANNALLLHNMLEETNRRARFRTVISLIMNGVEHQFEGICDGYILEQAHGTDGFGYDPLFIPDGGDGRTFAQLTLEEKNQYSHRRKAADKLIAFLHSVTL